MAKNPLFNMLNAGVQSPVNDMQKFIADLQNLKNNLQCDPKQKVDELIKSGVMSQKQFAQFQQMANAIYPMVKGMF